MEHETNRESCWCGPDVYQLCPMCGGSDEGCAYCLAQTGKPGLVHEYDEEQDCIVVHQDT